MGDRLLYSARDFRFSYGKGQADAIFLPFLELEEGSCVALVGPNGSGKSTFLKLLNGLLPGGRESVLFSGELRFRNEVLCGSDGASIPKSLRRSTVYLHQHPYMLSGSVARNLEFVCRARGVGGREAARKTSEALALVGMDGAAFRRKRGLSGGEIQRLALARVIASGAEVLLLDEPMASADASSRDLMTKALFNLATAGTTIIFSVHGDELVDALADRVIEFDRGAIIGDGRSARC